MRTITVTTMKKKHKSTNTYATGTNQRIKTGRGVEKNRSKNNFYRKKWSSYSYDVNDDQDGNILRPYPEGQN